jgi:energy-coupling factor transporter transmembrane protein EcfT
MKKILIYSIPVLNIILLLVLWINIELDVKFKFGPEQETWIFNGGQELAKRSSVFILISIVFNLITLLVIYFLNRGKKKVEADIDEQTIE